MTPYSEVPNVVVKAGKMFGGWSQNARLFALMAATIFVIYTLLLLRTLYLKDQRLEQIDFVAADTRMLLMTVKSLDQKLAADLERLEAIRSRMERHQTI